MMPAARPNPRIVPMEGCEEPIAIGVTNESEVHSNELLVFGNVLLKEVKETVPRVAENGEDALLVLFCVIPFHIFNGNIVSYDLRRLQSIIHGYRI